MKRSWPLPAILALAACASFPPGAGWSRAPDLSVYSAMRTFSAIAREQESLCDGFSPASVDARWNDRFGGREGAVRTGLSERHGEAAVIDAETRARPTRSVSCPQVPDGHWQSEHGRLLTLLEMRLGLR
ncbi:MAG: hypothetical protein ACT4OE_05675 [Sphingosinicella sp.]